MTANNMLSPALSVPRDERRSFALVFHLSNLRSDMYGHVNESLAISRHPVLRCDGKPHIGAGAPFAASDLAQLTAILSDTNVNEGMLLPTNLLGRSVGHLCWYVPGKIRPMWFAVGDKTVRLNVPWPNLVFLVKDGKLSVAAYKGTRRPGANTRLFHAPLSNIYAATNVCIGSATVPADMSLQSMAGWEGVIFDTRFSHVNHTATLKLLRRGQPVSSVSTTQHVAFWKKLDKAGKSAEGAVARFPAEHLVPLNLNLSDYLVRAK